MQSIWPWYGLSKSGGLILKSMAMLFHWLVVYLLLWKIWKSVGTIIPNIWKNVPNHQPAMLNSCWWENDQTAGFWGTLFPQNHVPGDAGDARSLTRRKGPNIKKGRDWRSGSDQKTGRASDLGSASCWWLQASLLGCEKWFKHIQTTSLQLATNNKLTKQNWEKKGPLLHHQLKFLELVLRQNLFQQIGRLPRCKNKKQLI